MDLQEIKIHIHEKTRLFKVTKRYTVILGSIQFH